MSLILQPQSSFPIVRQIANHLDTDTLYVQAVVRNADGDTIDTIQLEDKGGQRFQRRYRVPVDSSGQGAYISIITSVYTDAGYTTKSPNYGDEENTYLVFDRVMPAMRGGGGNTGITIKQVRQVMSEELEKIKPEPVELEEEEDDEPEPESPRFVEILDAIASVKQAVEDKVIPEYTEQLTALAGAIAEVKTAVDEKEVTPETELEPVYEEMDMLKEAVMGELMSQRDFLQKSQAEIVETIKTEVKDNMQNTEFQTNFSVSPKKNQPSPMQTSAPQLDLSKLV